MDNRVKNAIYSLVLLSAIVIVYFIRKDNEKQDLITLTGHTMGPIVYTIKYFDDNNRNLKPQVDSLLKEFNQSLSTYIPGSEISRFNRDSVFEFETPFFYEALVVTSEISKATDGAFNPAIMPLVNAWGFGPEKGNKPDSAQVDSLRKLVNYDLVIFDSSKVWKLNKAVSLDFSASAKGQGVDVVCEYLESLDISNYFVEIGGEVRSKGKNLEKDKNWVVGILHPESKEEDPFFYATVEIKNRAMATSGNYFNYRIVDGQRYSHTLSPFTGYPIVLAILSATVVADDCQTADALATAFMVMGHEKAIDFLNNNRGYDALILYTAEGGEIKHFNTDGININILRQ